MIYQQAINPPNYSQQITNQNIEIPTHSGQQVYFANPSVSLQTLPEKY